MKNVLIIAYHFNKKETIGSIRMRGLAKYLPEYGWNPTILTPQLDCTSELEFRYNIIETNYDDITTIWKKRLGFKTQETVKKQLGKPTYKNKKLLIDYVLKVWEDIFAYPDPKIGWYKYAVDAGEKLLNKGKYNAILSSSSPATCHLVARKLKNTFGIPWVADFRDLWTQNHYIKHCFVRQIFEKRLEKSTLSVADVLTTVSEPLADKLILLHRKKTVYTITNGFDPDNKNPGLPLSDKMNIAYTGTIYPGKQDPEPLIKALYELYLENKIDLTDFKVDFYGYDKDWLINDIKKYGLQSVINVYGRVPSEEAIKKQREAQVLLLLNWNDPQEKGIYTGKIFDYLAAKRPILSIGQYGGVVNELLEDTKTGMHVSNLEDLKSALLKFYEEYKKTGSVSYQGIAYKVDKYSHREMARKFAEVLDSISK